MSNTGSNTSNTRSRLMADQAIGLLSGYLRHVRVSTVTPYLTAPVLDIGCGSGYLSQTFPSGDYTGADIDEDSLIVARKIHPEHPFYLINDLPDGKKFNTILLLAVIEHTANPCALILRLAEKLTTKGKLVITTPHPSFQQFYELGARIGLFSRTAANEHHQYIDLLKMKSIISGSQLILTTYHRFLYGANQLFILSRQD